MRSQSAALEALFLDDREGWRDSGSRGGWVSGPWLLKER